MPEPAVRLSELAAELAIPHNGKDVEIAGVRADSRLVAPGELFVAVPGQTRDGATFIEEALRKGAAAICARELPNGVSGIECEDPRAALALLSSAIHGHPARALRILGITGSLGKTSVASLVEACLTRAGESVGVIGSLGVRIAGEQWETGMTTPDAPVMHEAFRRMVDRGVTTVVMEVTSHALLLDRVRGLNFAAGIFTNLVPDEHLEFHPTAEHYIQTKLRFLDHLESGAPLVVDADDDRLRAALAPSGYPAVGVSMHGRPDAAILVETVRTHARGSDLMIHMRQAVCGTGGAFTEPCTLRVRLPLLGRPQVTNAALAATAALALGADQGSVEAALTSMRPVHRRLEVVFDEGPLVIDDTVGNPRSIAALREVIAQLPGRKVRVVYAIRGRRGPAINRRNAQTLAALVKETGAALTVTASEDVTDGRNRVSAGERDAVTSTLSAAGARFDFEPRLDSAVTAAVESCAPRDVLLLLGAQGMDAGAEIARRTLGVRPERGASQPASPPRATAAG